MPDRPAPVSTTSPVISGTAQQGDTLSVSDGGWSGSPAGFGYAWADCDPNGLNCVPISGADKNTYTLQGGDVGDTIEASVTATNAGGSTTATTTPTGRRDRGNAAGAGEHDVSGDQRDGAAGRHAVGQRRGVVGVFGWVRLRVAGLRCQRA